MLPAGVLTARRAVVAAARPRWAVSAGIRHRSGDNRKCATATCRLPEPKRRSYVGCGRRATDFPAAAGYCTARAGKKTVPFVLADIGEGISEVTVKEWYVNVGDVVSEFDDVCEVESDKATVTITSRYAGTVTKVHHETGATARVGSALVDIEVAEEGHTAEEPAAAVAAAASAPEVLADDADRVVAGSSGEPAGLDSSDASVASKVLTTPAVRRIAAEKGIDLTTVRGTGKQGRVLKEDLLGFEDHLLSSSVPTPFRPGGQLSADRGLCAADGLRQDHAEDDGGVQQDTDFGDHGRGEPDPVDRTEGAAGAARQADAAAVPGEGHVAGAGPAPAHQQHRQPRFHGVQAQQVAQHRRGHRHAAGTGRAQRQRRADAQRGRRGAPAGRTPRKGRKGQAGAVRRDGRHVHAVQHGHDRGLGVPTDDPAARGGHRRAGPDQLPAAVRRPGASGPDARHGRVLGGGPPDPGRGRGGQVLQGLEDVRGESVTGVG
ncbi:unnamed protein product [Aphis gossypii]|uniref:Lipoamide acyltransferase component of branched-chain alpha-keto acid dehydrogenase complex, mitochondrial n=1 Tax=Aphis gossypii TaxID=80765 RepID=A0A9P0NG14_APHGO|nr:unnamed protein product [Aphis gossypii]